MGIIRVTGAELTEIKHLCRRWGPQLRLFPDEPVGAAVLYMLFLNERYNQDNTKPRFEKAYGPGGRYHCSTLYKQYGEAACCSYSNFQLLFVTACELGFTGTPQELDQDDVAIEWVVRLLNSPRMIGRRKRSETVDLRFILDGYNSGNPTDPIVPSLYIERGEKNYALAFSDLELPSPRKN